MKSIPALLLCFSGLLSVPAAQAFSFDDDERQGAVEGAARRAKTSQQLATPCKSAIKDKGILVAFADQTANGYQLQTSKYGRHTEVINQKLKALGLKTYTPEEQKARIAQAEMEAYFRNDPDAALAASSKMGAAFILKGGISTRTAYNQIVRLPEVYVTLNFTLAAADGRTISSASAKAESYSGNDTASMALELINEQADGVVAKLYADYCRAAGSKK